MILGTLADAERYFALNPLFREGIEYVRAHADAPVGKYEIRGEDCFVMFVEATKRPISEAKLEVHDRYIDVQVVLEGKEGFGWKPRVECVRPVGAFNTEKDILLFDDAYEGVVEAKSGEMVIFFPEDGHAPLVGEGPVRKAIIKVKA